MVDFSLPRSVGCWASEVLILLLAIACSADTHFVAPQGEHVFPFESWDHAATNLQAGIDAASGGDIVLVGTGTYSIAQQVVITNAVTVQSLKGAERTLIDAAGQTRGIFVNHTNAYVTGFTVLNGDSGGSLPSGSVGGGVFCEAGVVATCTVANSRAYTGGGIGCGGYGNVVSCTVEGNYGGNDSGGIACWGGRITGCTIRSNSVGVAGNPAGMSLAAGASAAGCTIVDNGGPGVYVGSVSVLASSWIVGNGDSTAQGGGVIITEGGLLSACTIVSNTAAALGGGVYLEDSGRASDCTIRHNTALYGGGVALSGSATIISCEIESNHALYAGGGIHSDGGSIVDCIVEGNEAPVGGGLSLSFDGATFGVDGCTFTGNTADTGGGVFCGPLSTVDETVPNLLENAANFSNALASLDIAAENLTNMLSQLPGGTGTVPPPGTAGSPGCPDMMRASCDLSSYSNVMRNCHVVENTAVCGGGVFMLDASAVVISNCIFSRNLAQLGGGLCAQNTGAIVESTLVENEATAFGGGMLMLHAGLMLNCHVITNRAELAAGGCGADLFDGATIGIITGTCGMSTYGADALRVVGSEFIGNTAGITGGGLTLSAGRTATSNTFFRNSAPWGGGVANWGGDLSQSVFVENHADLGGAIFATGGKTETCKVVFNSADGIGGGIAAFPLSSWGGAVVEACQVQNNFAPGGGGIALLDSALAQECTVISNVAGIAGGGVFCMLGGEVQSSLVRHNEAGNGAGVYCLSGGKLVNSTITKNGAVNSGGGLVVVTNDIGAGWQYDTDTTVANSILYGNTASNAPNLLSLASNVTYSYTCTIPLVPGTGNITNAPQFVDEAGADYHLQDSSPCIDAGSNGLMPSGTDLDGLSRPLDGDNDGTATVDMGCYEHLNRAADSDGDTMPDGWEFDNDLNPVADDASQDPDSDAMNNRGEYVADTNPQDPESVLSVINVAAELGGIRVDWKGGREAWQFLECCPDLASTTNQWTAILAVPPPTPMTNAIIDLGATNQTLFYRIRAER